MSSPLGCLDPSELPRTIYPLSQHAPSPKAPNQPHGWVVPDRDGEWRTAGWTERPPRARRTAIVAPGEGLSGSIELRAHPLAEIDDEHVGDALAVSRHGTLAVPTHHTRAQGPAGAQRQLDFVFASHSIAQRVEVRALNGIDQ